MTDTIELIDTSDPAATEGLRQLFRRLWSDPQNVKFRRSLRMQPANYRWATLGGTDPLPDVQDPPLCQLCFEQAASDEFGGKCYDCWAEEDSDDD